MVVILRGVCSRGGLTRLPTHARGAWYAPCFLPPCGNTHLDARPAGADARRLTDVAILAHMDVLSRVRVHVGHPDDRPSSGCGTTLVLAAWGAGSDSFAVRRKHSRRSSATLEDPRRRGQIVRFGHHRIIQGRIDAGPPQRRLTRRLGSCRFWAVRGRLCRNTGRRNLHTSRRLLWNNTSRRPTCCSGLWRR
jgi:hypothetical protein